MPLYNLRITVTHVLEIEDWNPNDYVPDFDGDDSDVIEFVKSDDDAVDSALDNGEMTTKVEIISKREHEDQGPSVLGLAKGEAE
jgi:hypothetical protein